ncbi:MAG: N-acetylmuramic acid 6-phosphate etherase, partial [Ruegeria sp.]
ISAGATAMAATLSSGGVLYYIAAGSSGLMAAADAMELGGTFDIPSDQIRILMAGGLPTSADMPGDTEDDVESLEASLSKLTNKDAVIAVSASGTTPYTIAAARIALAKGATLIGIANNANSALLNLSHHAILLETPPEVLSGSTRMGAGTSQKITLNMLSTLMAIKLGHIYDGMMVNLRADNAKLRSRAEGIVCAVVNVSEYEAKKALQTADGNVKLAILLAGGCPDPIDAKKILDDSKGNVRNALKALG